MKISRAAAALVALLSAGPLPGATAAAAAFTPAILTRSGRDQHGRSIIAGASPARRVLPSSSDSAPSLFSASSRRGQTALSALPPTAAAASAAAASSTATTIASSSVNTDSLTQFFLETAIAAGVPALFWILVIGFAGRIIASAARSGDDGDGGGRSGGGGRDGGDPFGGPSAVQDLYDDLYSDGAGAGSRGRSGGSLLGSFGGRDRRNKPALQNLGIPTKQYLKITRINDRYDSYAYTLTSATQSKALASYQLRSANFQRALAKSLTSTMTELTAAERTDLLRVERELLKVGGDIMDEIGSVQRKLTDLVIREEMDGMDVGVGEVDPEHFAEYEKDMGEGEGKSNGKNVQEGIIVDVVIEDEEGESTKDSASDDGEANGMSSSNTTATTNTSSSTTESSKKTIAKIKKTGLKSMIKSRSFSSDLKELEKLQTELTKLELAFVRSVIEILGPDRANAVRVAIMGNVAGGGMAAAGTMLTALRERPLTSVLKSVGYAAADATDDSGSGEDGRKKSLFVTDFPGDVSASQVKDLREEVTAIIRSAKPGDEALVVLQSGGGTVTGYGLAAAQLRRFKANGMKLTVCVEQVAASGGYMMCCVADRIVASPFAVLGSIGVISDMPNVYERLKREGVEFQTVTAGKYKRTLTPTKKVTSEDIKKSKEDVEDILKLFKGFVHENRPQLDIDDVATGETWFGTDALERKLCDEIRTADDVLVEYVDRDYDVYEVKYDPPPEQRAGALLDALPLGDVGGGGGLGDAYSGGGGSGIIGGLVRWVVRSIVPAVKEEFEKEMEAAMRGGDDASRRYMMKDDAADRIRVQDE